MKNLAKFLLFVLLLSAGISLLYDYRLKHGGLKVSSGRAPEKYTLAAEPAVNPKQVASLESLNQERRALVNSVVPSVVAVKTSTKLARLVGADEQVDLAVLKIDEPGVKPLKLADSDMVQPGDFVLAIGNPLGFDETVTDGIISSKGRPNRSDAFAGLLQTNAAINPGNSGGPLINIRGEVIGINTAIASTTGGSQGLGFAIPSNTVHMALESLLKQGRIIRGYLGIQTGPLQRGASGSDTGGVTVGEVVSGSPAEQAGLQPGDVIRRFG